MPAGRLLLIDAANVLYRAFFAISSLTTRDGRPTNALFGFVRMLKQWERLWRPTHWAVVFDEGTPPERLALLDTYKANRAPTPDALRPQFDLLDRYLACCRMARLRAADTEADDLMATAAARFREYVDEVLLVSSDKDLFQLVDDRVHIVLPTRPDQALGPDEVRGKTGIEPRRIVDWLSLVGDTVDNIPGVPGIGHKTASSLIAESASLDDLLTHPERAKSARVRESLAASRQLVLRNAQLVRLRTDVPLQSELADLRVAAPNEEALMHFFDEVEFHSMAAELRTPSLC